MSNPLYFHVAALASGIFSAMNWSDRGWANLIAKNLQGAFAGWAAVMVAKDLVA